MHGFVISILGILPMSLGSPRNGCKLNTILLQLYHTKHSVLHTATDELMTLVR